MTIAWLLSAAVVLVWLMFSAFLPRHAIWLVVLWVPIQGWVQLNVFGDSNTTVLVYEVQILGLYLIFTIKVLKSPKAFGLPKVVLFALPIAVWAMFLVPYSLSRAGFVLTAIGLRTYLLPLPLAWLGYHAFRNRDELERLGAVLSIEMAIIGAVAALQYTSFVTSWGSVVDVPTGYVYAGTLRPPGTFSTPGHLGMYILAMVPLAVGFLGLETTWRRRICYAIGLAGAVLALVVNTQRATVVLLCVCVPVIVVLARRASVVKVLAIAFILTVLGGAGGLSIVQGAFSERVRSISNDVDYTLRVAPLERMNDALAEPFIGGGLGTASPGGARIDVAIEKVAESFPAALVFQLGVPGLAFFCLFVGALLVAGYRALIKCRRSDLGLLAAAILAYEIAICLDSWSYDPLHYPPSRVIFWFWAGVILSLPRLQQQKTLHWPHFRIDAQSYGGRYGRAALEGRRVG